MILAGQLVAFDAFGCPSFNMPQNYGSSAFPIYFYAFELPMLAGRDLTSLLSISADELLQTKLVSKLSGDVPRVNSRGTKKPR
jgi:ATP-dependent DNA ligase